MSETTLVKRDPVVRIDLSAEEARELRTVLGKTDKLYELFSQLLRVID